MNPRDHALFRNYPLNGNALVSVGSVPTPYHIYDGYGVFIGGTADLAAVQTLLRGEQVLPLTTEAGRALMGIWICDFVEASLSPHHELQFSIFVTRNPSSPPLLAHPIGLLSAMLTRPDLQMLCHGLWNNTPQVVAYNRELLSLNARLTASHLEQTGGTVKFSFSDTETGHSLLDGQLALPQRTPSAITRALMTQMGFFRALRVARQPAVHMQVVNPLGVNLTHNAVADAYTSNATNHIREYTAATDRLSIGASVYRELDFEPQIIQFMTGFKFVYLNPR